MSRLRKCCLVWLVFTPGVAQAQQVPQGTPLNNERSAEAESDKEPKPDPNASADAIRKKLARDLAWAGVDLYKETRYGAAAEKFGEAYALQPVPTVGLWLARSFRQQAKLIEASEQYVPVMRMTLAPDSPEVYATAKQEAAAEYDRLQPRIPTLVLTVDPVVKSAVRIDVDGALLSSDLIGVKVPFNPGRVKIVARHGRKTASYTVLLEEKATETLQIVFVEPQSPASKELPTPEPPPVENGTRNIPTASWVALTAGGLGLATGIVFGVGAESRKKELSIKCPGYVCSSDHATALNDFNDARKTSLIGYGLGFTGIALAGLFYFNLGDEATDAVVLSPTSATLRGSF